jgi:deoxyribodipyrimidine photo-lyase
VHIAGDVSGFAGHRQQRLARALSTLRCELVVHEAVTTIQPPGAVRPAGSDHFSVFTPYHRQWSGLPRRRVVPVPERLRLPDGVDAPEVPDVPDVPDVPEGGPTHGWRAGESEARDRANAWFADGLARYEERHDDLAADATSHLSPYLHLGFLSPTELATKAAQRPGRGSAAFLRQLAWRDFHAQVLAARPEIAWDDYRGRGDRWADDDLALEAWKAGRTGYPLVDAGMRQLAAIGWMHNRARLVVGSFLSKTLYLDWRLGARYFLDRLLDGDLANNNLNWQWVAGTGTDTRPSRVLNPVRQAERYDPDGSYIRRWVPELADLEDAGVQQPWRLPESRRRSLDYPEPIVDLAEGRNRFLAARDGR